MQQQFSLSETGLSDEHVQVKITAQNLVNKLFMTLV